eukprot:6473143-Amphidinium_carterae.1
MGSSPPGIIAQDVAVEPSCIQLDIRKPSLESTVAARCTDFCSAAATTFALRGPDARATSKEQIEVANVKARNQFGSVQVFHPTQRP